MDKISATPEIDKLILDLINKHILRHTIQFFYKTDEGLRPFGSGVFALIHETYFILTASHVAEYLEKDENNLFIRVGKKKYINVIGDIKYTDITSSNGVDLAYIKLNTEMLPSLLKPYIPVTINKFSKHGTPSPGLSYCVCGFPEKNIKYETGSMETGASFYLTNASNDNPYEYYKMSKDDCFIVDIKGKGTEMKTGEGGKIDANFYGISGGGLWHIMLNNDPETNQYWVDYRLIGIMTQFRKGKYFCMIANKIHLILHAFTIIEGFRFRVNPKQ